MNTTIIGGYSLIFCHIKILAKYILLWYIEFHSNQVINGYYRYVYQRLYHKILAYNKYAYILSNDL